MKEIKRLELSITNYGEVIVEENPNGNYIVYNGHYGESNIGSPYKMLTYIKSIIPQDCEISLYRNEHGILIKNPIYEISFSFEFKKDSVRLFHKVGHNWNERDVTIAILKYKAPFNSLNLFYKLLNLAQKCFQRNKFEDIVTKYYPEASEIYPHYTDNFDKGTMILNDFRYFFEIKNNIPIIEAIAEEDDEGRTDILTEDDIKRKILTYQNKLSALRYHLITEKPKVVVKTDAELETERKIRNEARKLKPRIPELQEMTTYELLKLLEWSRTPGYYYTGDGAYQHEMWDPEVLKDELSHREHIPTKAEKKELRQKAATQHHGSKKIK